MRRAVHFAVSPRLTVLLGETYRQTEAALKELVDNSWDAGARHVWVTLPQTMTSDPIIIEDDGSGMSPEQVQQEYLEIARNRRTSKGEFCLGGSRRVKGRKGIGKFAGLAAARRMTLETVSNEVKSKITIDKSDLLDMPSDLERIPLPLVETPAIGQRNGTKVTLTELDQALNFPTEERLRTILLYEYGRETSIQIYVNGRLLDVEDLPGEFSRSVVPTQHAGPVEVRFTVAEGKPPKHAGFLLRVSGKTVGSKPQWFGLDEDEDIPAGLRKKLYGEINVEGLDGIITPDGGGFVENSKAIEEISQLIREKAKAALRDTYTREMNLHQGRLKQEIARRIANLPEHRRQAAEDALGRVLLKFYGERPDRIEAAASVVLDAMERDEYWHVLRNIDEAKHRDVADFADALERFGLVELAVMAEHARARMKFLDDLDTLSADPKTVEAQMHKAIENSLWIFGGTYRLMRSNETLGRIAAEYSGKKFTGARAKNRPDLLINEDPGDRYLVIEFKRPRHLISRIDEAQAQTYADDLREYLPAKPFDVIVIGGKREASSDRTSDPSNMRVLSYADIISRARYELQWVLRGQ